MKEFLKVPIEYDQKFREACDDMDLLYYCHREEELHNIYDVRISRASDLFYLGLNIGFDAYYKNHIKGNESGNV